MGHWTADGLLAIFFLVAGIELKRELVIGELRTPATAALPVVAAFCGMAVPAALYAAVAATGGAAWTGWAVPMATDIAFALAVLAVLSTHLPSALRAFLLTLAVVDDLGAILIIAIFFTDDLNLAALAGAFIGLVVFYLLQRHRVTGWWWYVPLGFAIWALMYNGGVHATVAGVAMGLILRATRDTGEKVSPGERTAHLSCTRSRPGSRCRCSPCSPPGSASRLPCSARCSPARSRSEWSSAWLSAKRWASSSAPTWPPASPGPASTPTWPGPTCSRLAVLAGIGFTVALLIGELAFPDPAAAEHIKAAVLIGSLIAAGLATLLIKRRNGVYRHLWEEETRDEDADGIPDIYQPSGPVPDGDGTDR